MRDSDRKGATYGPGGWRSRRREERRPDVVAAVQAVAKRNVERLDPHPNWLGELLERYIYSKGGTFKINTSGPDTVWLKFGWRTAAGPVYIVVRADRHQNTYSALLDLCEQMEEVERGLRRPSPDAWHGR